MIELKVLKRNLADSNEYVRSQGLVPAVLYGTEFESTPISVEDIAFRKVYREAGTSNIINTTGDIKGEMCIVQDMQVHVVSGQILHIDFKAVSKGQKTEVAVPITLLGESPAVKNSIGLLNFSHEELAIETIPSKIPDHLEIDISGLAEIGDNIKAKEITLPEGVTLVDDAETTIASIIAIVENVEEVVEEPVSMEPEMVDQKGKEEVAEGESNEAEKSTE